MKLWTVAYTQASKELMAETHLVEQGFKVYVPRYKKIRRHAKKVDTIIAPLFPRYLFVAYDTEIDPWRSIRGTRGISYLLMNKEKPAMISSSIIQHLKAQEDQAGIVPIQTLALFAPGEKVRILDGAFEGYTATFEKMNDIERVELLLNFLGRETKMTLPLYAVEAM